MVRRRLGTNGTRVCSDTAHGPEYDMFPGNPKRRRNQKTENSHRLPGGERDTALARARSESHMAGSICGMVIPTTSHAGPEADTTCTDTDEASVVDRQGRL